MTEVEDLLQNFKGAFEAGDDPNPRRYLEQVEGADRLTLELLIDRYLNEEAPIRQLDDQALAEERASEEGQRMANLVAEPGPADLLMARRLQDLSVADVAESLLDETGLSGATDAEKAKTAEYLDRLERGQMPPISDRVVEALKKVLEVKFEIFFVAFSPGTSFRMSSPDDSASQEDIEISKAILAAYATPGEQARDRVDELFFGSA